MARHWTHRTCMIKRKRKKKTRLDKTLWNNELPKMLSLLSFMSFILCPSTAGHEFNAWDWHGGRRELRIASYVLTFIHMHMHTKYMNKNIMRYTLQYSKTGLLPLNKWKSNIWISDMAQGVSILATKPNDFSTTSMTHMVERELQVRLWFPKCELWHTRPSHMHTWTIKSYFLKRNSSLCLHSQSATQYRTKYKPFPL